MKKEQIEKYISKFEALAKNEDNKKLKSNVVIAHLEFNDASEEDTQTIVHRLEDMGLIITPKGFASMSKLQKIVHRFINEQLLGDLMRVGESTLKVNEEDLKSLVDEGEGKYFVLNVKGDLIKPSCNNTNITEARRVAHAKKLMDEAQPNK